MEKLEKILHAEEAARLRVTEAREEAVLVVRDAAAQAAEIRAKADEAAADEAQARASAILGPVHDGAEKTRMEHQADLARTLERADARVERALVAVLEDLAE
ncbi:MAG: hypothetical protein U1E08_00170 [Coriobacteriia bacterium]|nr:hypothetical protein [Actinomycetota bacterium]MDZ4166103.1 hypothetical protein [Coriobacteriia bacterium]